MKFKSLFSRNRKPSPNGFRFKTLYVRGGNGELVESGKEDLFDTVQKAADGRTIEDLIRRATNGDSTAIGEPVDSFVDISAAPKDLIEAYTMLNNAKSSFDRLSKDVKAKFNNDYSTFLEASANGKLASLLQPNKKSADSNVPSLSADDIAKLKNLIGGSTNA